MDVVLEPVMHRLRTPLRTAYGDVHERGIYRLSLTGPDGITGHGEAAPLEAYDGVPFGIVGQALERYAEVLADDRGRTGPTLLDACREVADRPRRWPPSTSRSGMPPASGRASRSPRC